MDFWEFRDAQHVPRFWKAYSDWKLILNEEFPLPGSSVPYIILFLCDSTASLLVFCKCRIAWLWPYFFLFKKALSSDLESNSPSTKCIVVLDSCLIGKPLLPLHIFYKDWFKDTFCLNLDYLNLSAALEFGWNKVPIEKSSELHCVRFKGSIFLVKLKRKHSCSWNWNYKYAL